MTAILRGTMVPVRRSVYSAAGTINAAAPRGPQATGGRHVEGEFLGTQQTVVVGIGGLELAQVVAVARDGARVELSAESTAAIQASRTHIDELAETGRAVYGVSTGFGALATRYIEPEQRAQLQRSLVRSHAAGSGPASRSRSCAR